MAHFIIRNRADGQTIETHEFDTEQRYDLYEAYSPGTSIVCQAARYRVHTVAWNRATQEFIVGCSFEAYEPAAVDLYC